MKNTIRHIILLLVLLPALPGSLCARTDSIPVLPVEAQPVPDYRYPDQARIDEFRESDEFRYLDQAAPGDSLWDRFWAWVNRILNYLFAGESQGYLGLFLRILIYALALAAIGFAIYRLVLIRTGKVLQRPDGSPVNSQEIEENIHELDFETLIQEATQHKNWRLAIRLRYLQTLKILNDRQLIQWEPYKTNHEYSYEIDAPLRERFDRISYYFDYAWYGEFDVTEFHFNRVGTLYEDMQREI